MTWPDSVDEALCVGWIDGIRKRIDAGSYMIRFTPRRRGSIWSAVTIKRVAVLTNEKRMQPAGRAAFADRRENKSGIYSYEQRTAQLPEPYATRLKDDKAAWKFFQDQPLSYRKAIGWWVMSAKQEKTRQMRLGKLIAASASGRHLRLRTRHGRCNQRTPRAILDSPRVSRQGRAAARRHYGAGRAIIPVEGKRNRPKLSGCCKISGTPGACCRASSLSVSFLA
jgi:uncharacterized protein YdeI (YjbR/CyaY-like superfamily)